MRLKKPIFLVVFAVILLGSAFGAIHLAQQWNIERRVNRVHDDWEKLRSAMTRFGCDYCGLYLPSDTTWRSAERPTFETIMMIHPDGPRGALGVRRTHLLTTPVAYIDRYPEDAFNPGNSYGYVAWSFFDGEPPMAALQSPGPDRDTDVSLPRVYSILQKTLEKGPPGTSMGQLWTRKTLDCFAGLVNRFGYDPTNGLTSNGDLLQLYAQRGPGHAYGLWGEVSPADESEETISDEEIESLLNEVPIDVAMPLPRWRNVEEEPETLEIADNWFAVRESVYLPFKDVLDACSEDDEDPLVGLTNKLGAFAEFFAEPGPLTAEQSRQLAQWRKKDPGWWNRFAGERIPDKQRFHYMDIEKYAEFYVFYGKSALLGAGELLAAKDFERAGRIANDLLFTAGDLRDAYYVKPAPPLAQRSSAEITRMARRIRELAEAAITEQE